MARYSYTSESGDAAVSSFSASTYAAARDGNGDDIVLIDGTEQINIGQDNDGSSYSVKQGFLIYDNTPASSEELVTSAHVALPGLSQFDYGTTTKQWALQAWDGAFDIPVSTGDFVAGDNLDDHTLLAQFDTIISQRPAPAIWRSGSAELRARASGSSPLKLLLASREQLRGFTPTNQDNIWLGTFESTIANRPVLNYSTTTLSSLTRVLSSSVQLTDGTHVYIDLDSGMPVVKHNPSGTTFNTVATLSTSAFALKDGARILALIRDGQNNLYVVGPSPSLVNGITIQAFVKGAGYSWTAKTALSNTIALPYEADINQVAATVHAVGGSTYIAAVVAHAQGQSMTNQAVVVSLSASAALAGSGTAVVDVVNIPAVNFAFPINATGNGIDILARAGGAGVVAAARFDLTLDGENEANVGLYRYVISGNGSFSTEPTASTASPSVQGSASAAPNADGDLRVKLIPISGSNFAMLWGARISVLTDVPNSLPAVTTGRDLIELDLATFPTDHYGPFDAVYDQSANKVWIYYFDIANSRRLMRTGFSVASGLPTGEETEVATGTGASGSTNLAIRLPIGAVDERRLLVHLGNRSGGGTHATVTIADTSLNQAPNVPVLTNPGTFNAAAAKTFSWLFSDNNVLDSQSAFQAQIRDQSSGTVVYDSNKVTSGLSSFVLPAETLSNVETYEWRVRVYDQVDQVSAYSAYQQFSTVDTGIVAITVPAVDNQAGLASPRLTVHWTYTADTGTQASYRVRVIRADTGATVFDSGFIFGPTVTSYTLNGLITDIEQRVEVMIEDDGSNISNTATRLVTPSFSAPNAPIITAQAMGDGSGITVSVVNPTPTGDLPPAGRNDIYRAISGTGEFIKVGEAARNSSFIDYGVAADVDYDYQAFAVADGQTASNIVEGVSISFFGVYIHRPANASGTVRHFLYGGATNSEEVTPTSTELRFVGRAYPVFEYGDQFSQQVSVNITVPFDEDWTASTSYLREIGRSRAVHCYRDGRGRKIFGVVNGTSEDDEQFGSTVSLSVVRVDYVEELP